MIVLLAAGIGVSVMGLLAIAFGVPISDSSFGNALTIGGIVVLCTGLILLGMAFVVRELANLAKLLIAQGAPAVRTVVAPRHMAVNPFAAPLSDDPVDDVSDRGAGPVSPAPWAGDVAMRARPRPASPEPMPAAPAEPSPPPAPDRPARRNLLFATRRRDKSEHEPAAAPPLPTALEVEPKASFENAWPTPSRSNGSPDRTEPPNAPSEPARDEPAATGPAGAEAASAGEVKQPRSDLPPGVTVVRSGTVDEMAYTYYSDGSIEAQLAGESPIRFASLDDLRTYVEQRK